MQELSGVHVEPYSAGRADVWNRFIAESKNGTFLFNRSYMDYHSDRFRDASVMVYRDTDLVAVMPANLKDLVVQSHGGLTFGGLITGSQMSTPRFLEIFAAVLDYYRERGGAELEYKPVPRIYHRYPSEEDLYALFLADAECWRRDVSSAIPSAHRLPYQKRRQREVKSAQRRGIRVEESSAWEAFWEVLRENLSRKHGLKPVHTLDEITLLHSRFPDNIRLFSGSEGDELQAGVVVYEGMQVAHAQYIGCSEEGRKTGALDALFAHLIENVYRDKPWFSFGVSTEDGGRYLNKGLIEFKEGFGARAVTQDFFRIDLGRVDLSSLKADGGSAS